MDHLSTRKFLIKPSTTPDMTVIRDRNASYHPHIVPTSKLPTKDEMAQMNTEQFDEAMHKLCYRN
jgi:hypothetical protein